MFVMRKWFAIFLLLVIPMQFALAASAAYCQHETGIATDHIGHHNHKHQVQPEELLQPDKTQSTGFDLDCGNCHAGCSVAVSTSEESSILSEHGFIHPSTDRILASPPLEAPDRPQWLPRS